MKKNKSKTFKCFKCGEALPMSKHRRSGRRPNGSPWHICIECSDAYRREREMDREAYHAAEGDVRVGKKGYEHMGWNGIPSDRSLRRRSQ